MSSPEQPVERIPHEQAPPLDIRSGHVTTCVEPEQDAQPSMLDSLAQDTKAADEPPEYPPGAPKFYPLLRMPYRRRARSIRLYGDLQAYLKAHPELQKAGEEPASEEADAEVDMSAAADSYEMVAVMDEFMASVAHDPDAYENWPDRYDIDTFMATWSAYQAASQPGEASSSSS